MVYSGPTHWTCIKRHRTYHRNFLVFLESVYDAGDALHCIIVLGRSVLYHYNTLITKVYLRTHGRVSFMGRRDDRCYDLGSYRLALDAKAALLHRYSFFIFLNCGVLGPFLQSPDDFWPESLIHPLRDGFTKLVGLSMNCQGKRGVVQAHVQSMLWGTDNVGLAVIMKSGVLFSCDGGVGVHGPDRDGFINRYELGLSRAVLGAGYGIRGLAPLQKDIIYTVANATKTPPLHVCRDLWTKEDFPSGMLFLKATRFPLPSSVLNKVINRPRKNIAAGLYDPCTIMSTTAAGGGGGD